VDGQLQFLEHRLEGRSISGLKGRNSGPERLFRFRELSNRCGLVDEVA
jgi:hypothetical protein